MNPTTLGVIGPGFLNQVPTLQAPEITKELPRERERDCRFGGLRFRGLGV